MEVAEIKKEVKIFESVPGKQVSLSHVLANPDQRVFEKLGLKNRKHTAIGFMTITPGEAAIIAGDITEKAASVELAFVDRFSGTVLILGDVSSVTTALTAANVYLESEMGMNVTEVTRL
jgi:ethanolamine utilization protein EutS